jgi:hypothetical protein
MVRILLAVHIHAQIAWIEVVCLKTCIAAEWPAGVVMQNRDRPIPGDPLKVLLTREKGTVINRKQ